MMCTSDNYIHDFIKNIYFHYQVTARQVANVNRFTACRDALDLADKNENGDRTSLSSCNIM